MSAACSASRGQSSTPTLKSAPPGHGEHIAEHADHRRGLELHPAARLLDLGGVVVDAQQRAGALVPLGEEREIGEDRVVRQWFALGRKAGVDGDGEVVPADRGLDLGGLALAHRAGVRGAQADRVVAHLREAVDALGERALAVVPSGYSDQVSHSCSLPASRRTGDLDLFATCIGRSFDAARRR